MMNFRIPAVSLFAIVALLIAAASVPLHGQRSTSASDVVVPTLVSFSGVLTNSNGRPLTGITGVTFSLYAEPQGGAPLWLETQNVQPDATGHYSVMLGSTSGQGLPSSLFVSGQAQWLGVQAQGQEEQPRVMLLAVPYALKALDAETVGGKPWSAFALANPEVAATGNVGGQTAVGHSKMSAETIGGSGTTGYLAEWTSGSNLGNSLLFQNSAGNLGISTTTPSQKFEVDLGNALVRGPNNFHASGNTAYLYVGDINHLVGASYGGGLTLGAYKAPQGLFVQDLTGNVGIGTSTPAQKFEIDLGNLLARGADNFQKSGDTANVYVGDTNHLVSASWGGGLALGAYKVPQALFIHDTTGNVGIGTTTPGYTLDVEGTGVINAGTSYNLGGQPFAYGTLGNGNAFLGFAGSTTLTGTANTASGYQALSSDTVGCCNTASGFQALYSNMASSNTASGYQALYSNTIGGGDTAIGYEALSANTQGEDNAASGYWALLNNTTGNSNTASGFKALYLNTTGVGNTADGDLALSENITGGYDTAIGYSAGQTLDFSEMTASNNTFLGASSAASTGTLTNATAIGFNAVVAESNALVLGCVSGVNGCPAAVSVGIGTTSPDNLLSVNGNADKPGGGSWGTFSDRRLKTLAGSFNAGLSQILKINPVRYRYKADNALGIHDPEEHVGLVA